MNFSGKRAIVTGGTRGIGKSICVKLCEYGCEVFATGTSIDTNPRSQGERINYLQLDLLEDHSIKQFISNIERMGNIDILINNAGINIIEPIDTLTMENWMKIIKVNLTGPMVLMKSISKIMKDNNGGRILNISSIWGIIGKEKRNSYAATKTGIIGLTRTVALDLAPYNILVNALCPGFTKTELTNSTLSREEIDNLASEVPLRRLANVEEVANVAIFLCSEMNTYITGQTIIVDGGFTIK